MTEKNTRPKITTRKGEMNGCYLVTKYERQGSRKSLTLKCTVCGFEIERQEQSFRKKYLDKFASGTCFCSVWKGRSASGRCHGTLENALKSYYRGYFQERLRRALSKHPDMPHDDFDTIWETVGSKPQDTDMFTWELVTKGRGHGKPDLTADNMEWSKRLKREVRDKVMGESLTTLNHVTVSQILRTKGTLSDIKPDDLLRKYRKAFGEEWRHFVGKRFGRFKVVDFWKDHRLGKVYYWFAAECRCGHRITRLASVFYSGKVECAKCQWSASKARDMTKNSSTNSRSKLTRLRMTQAAKASRKGMREMDIEALMLMKACHSFYSLEFGTEDTMNFFIDCDLAGKGEEIRQIYWRG